jgi:hypothetical protein
VKISSFILQSYWILVPVCEHESGTLIQKHGAANKRNPGLEFLVQKNK